MIGYFEAAARSKKNGMFPRYNTRDSITNSMFYEKGIPGYICNFHENEKKMVVVDNEKNINTYLNSWDGDGNDVTADTFSNNGLSRNCHQDTACDKQTVNLEDSFLKLSFLQCES